MRVTHRYRVRVDLAAVDVTDSTSVQEMADVLGRRKHAQPYILRAGGTRVRSRVKRERWFLARLLEMKRLSIA